MKTLLCIVAGVAIAYVLTSYVIWDPWLLHMPDWQSADRALFLGITIIGGLVGWLVSEW